MVRRSSAEREPEPEATTEEPDTTEVQATEEDEPTTPPPAPTVYIGGPTT